MPKEASQTVEKIDVQAVEVMNTQEEKEPKITRVRVDEQGNSKSGGEIPSVEEFLKNMNGGGDGAAGGMFDNPIMKLMSDPAEMAKAKLGAILIFVSIIFGFIGLFGFREYMGGGALLLGIIAYFFGADILKKGAMFAIFLGLFDLVIHIL